MISPNITVDGLKIPIFAYLRRSTTKVEQSESLLQQKEGIELIAEELGIDIENNVREFVESKSGFENRSRKKWKEMLVEIDKSKVPCIILARDTSRLSRNPTDNLEIANRMFGDNHFKKKISKIYFIGESCVVSEWNEQTNKKHIVDTLHQNYTASLETKDKSLTGVNLKLQAGEFPYTAPKGLTRHISSGKKILKQNEKFPFILRAFQMKAEGKTLKDISKYLKRYAGINIGARDITTVLFKNSVYIGEYTEKNTGKYYTNLLFVEGRPPISRALWDRVQNCLGRKISQYGALQEGDVLAMLLRTQEGRRLSRDVKKGKHVYYKSNAEKLNVSETFVLDGFINYIVDILEIIIAGKYVQYFRGKQVELREFEHKAGITVFSKIEKDINFPIESLTERQQEILSKGRLRREDYTKEEIQEIGVELLNSILKKGGYDSAQENSLIEANEKEWEKREREMKTDSVVLLAQDLKRSPHLENLKIDLKIRDREIQKLKTEIEELENDKKVYRKKALLMDFSKEEIEAETKEMNCRINERYKELEILSDDTDMEKYLERLPKILFETFELATNAVQEKNNEDMKGDLLKLIELTTVELTVNNKKELTVKLFDVLDGLTLGVKLHMEAPPGVEPGYEALQAPT